MLFEFIMKVTSLYICIELCFSFFSKQPNTIVLKDGIVNKLTWLLIQVLCDDIVLLDLYADGTCTRTPVLREIQFHRRTQSLLRDELLPLK